MNAGPWFGLAALILIVLVFVIGFYLEGRRK